MNSRLNQLKLFLVEDPEDSFILFAIAKEYEKQGKLDETEDMYLQIVKNEVEYVGVYYHLGKLYELKSNTPEAISVYKKGIEIAKKLKDFHAASELNSALLQLEAVEE